MANEATNGCTMESVNSVKLVTGGFIDLLAEACQTCADKTLLKFEDQNLSYKEILYRSLYLSSLLGEAGVGQGTRVALYFPNHAHFIPLFLAIGALGAVVVPINPLLKAEEIAHILSDSEASTLICHPQSLKTLLEHSCQCLPTLKNLFLVGEEVGLEHLEKLSYKNLVAVNEAQLARQKDVHLPDAAERVRLADDELALLVYTSGTTGKPKGAMLSVGNILFAVKTYPRFLNTDERDVYAAVLPLCHIYGLVVVLLGTIYKKASMVIFEHFDAHRLLRSLMYDAITVLPAVPTMFHFLLLEREKQGMQGPLPALRLGMCGGASMPPELLERLEAELNIPVQEGWALTECAVIATLNPIHKRKCGSIGQALPGIEVRVLDEQGRTLPAGAEHIGELCVRGANVMQGYLKRPEATAETLKDGFLHTGDLGYCDDEGYFYIVGRSKEMIIRGGMNIYPREVENVLLRHPGIKDAAVVGVSDPHMGERVKAYIVLAAEPLTESEIKHFCSEHLADYKVPRAFAFIESIPRNSTGKVLKRMLN